MSSRALINYDSEADVFYIVTRKEKETEFIEIAPGINVELNEEGEVIGIEIINASKFLKPVAKPLYQHMQMV